MIRDVLIIKDGLPMFSKNFTNRKNFISDQHNLMLVSGFLSALNSFSEEFEDLGSIKELKLSQSNFRLAFLKDNTIPNLIFLASFDEETNSVNVQKFLKKMSYTFLEKYNINKIANWDGRSDIFESFSDVVQKYIQNESVVYNEVFKNNVINLFKEIQENIDETSEVTYNNNIYSHSQTIKENSSLRNVIPIPEIPNDFNPDFYITGSLSKKLLRKIDGKKSIPELAQDLSLTEEKIFNLCKNLIKIGFVKLKEA